VELYTKGATRKRRERHGTAIVRGRDEINARGRGRWIDTKGMIAPGDTRIGYAVEQAGSRVVNQGSKAMAWQRAPRHRAAERSRKELMTEADPEDRNVPKERSDECARARIIGWGARAWREHHQ
jgi:hypothetical protein